jgi:hypothetical protein
MRSKLAGFALLCTLTLFSTGCPRLHSPGQEELARDIQERYKTLTPSAVTALEALDEDLEKLIESERADFDIYKETSENVLVTTTWSGLLNEISALEVKFNDKERNDVDKAIKDRKDAIEKLKKRSNELGEALKLMNEGLKKAEKQPTLNDQLNEMKRTINATVKALDDTLKEVQTEPGSPLSERLSITVKGLNDYLSVLDDKPEETQKVYSLIVEALRLGRDLAALEKEAVDQEASYHENVKGLLKAKLSLMPPSNLFTAVKKCINDRYPLDEVVQVRIMRLAHEVGIDEEVTAEKITENYKRVLMGAVADKASPSPAGQRGCDGDPQTRVDELRFILEQLALVQSVRLTGDMRIHELELRISAEKYRNAKLTEAIFERERMTLISFGLIGVVRYAEGGLRSEDIANLINIARAVAEIVIAARI